MHETPNCIAYDELMNDMAIPEAESRAWLDFLIRRGVAKANGDLWVNNNHQLDIERITFCIQHSIDDQDWVSLSLSINHNKTLPECLLKYNLNHWSYKKIGSVKVGYSIGQKSFF